MSPSALPTAAEQRRLEETDTGRRDWRRWGPYLAERQWGTVREDYSPGGTAWDYFPHDHARSRAYRWGEDGLAGWSDAQGRLCLALALWNGRDPILKERLFGLTNGEGNHGEDVKELYYYLDATPTHAYLKFLYKYPQAEFPYARLVEESARRRHDTAQPEYELLDTGVFDNDRYWDVFVEYAKADPEDVLMRITLHNRGSETAVLHLLPQLWFRNTWSWSPAGRRPRLWATGSGGVTAEQTELGVYQFQYDERVQEAGGERRRDPTLLFTENETNPRRHFGQHDAPGCYKDAFHEYLVHGNRAAVKPEPTGTKMAVHWELPVPPGGTAAVRLRLSADAARGFADFETILEQRRREADEFYAALQGEISDPDVRLVQRQALAGMIWSKQFYYYDVPEWLRGDGAQPPPPPERRRGRNHAWTHLNNADILSMPDKWEYPWYAAWDLAFHCLPLALVDVEFAKGQLLLLTREW